jgi:hypothetical protein
MRPALAALVTTAAMGLGSAASAVGSLVDVRVIDRSSGRELPVYRHAGRHYVAGQPGTRYAVSVRNARGERILAVMSVDGVNVLSGETASWDQAGYVFAPWQRYEVTGWRKSLQEVAAFEFTSLGEAYATRTGRPGHVGVIGVAVFRERPQPVAVPAPVVPYEERDRPLARSEEPSPRRDAPAAPAARGGAAPPAATAQGAARPEEEAAKSNQGLRERSSAAPAEKLGTGHGQRERSQVAHTSFDRAHVQPDELVTLYYDSRENLMAAGVIPAPRPLPKPAPLPFPDSPPVGFVADPPRRH